MLSVVQGFVEAKMLAKKFASLYYLLEDLLSPQKHYDWGLRAIKSVLVVAGSLLRAEEGQLESNVLFRALRDLNIAKILAQVRVLRVAHSRQLRVASLQPVLVLLLPWWLLASVVQRWVFDACAVPCWPGVVCRTW